MYTGEDIKARRAEMCNNITKGFTNGFESQGEIIKAKNVGDVHSNGKWVWSQLPSGKFDWRTIKSSDSKSTPNQSHVKPTYTQPASTPTPAVAKTVDSLEDTEVGKIYKITYDDDYVFTGKRVGTMKNGNPSFKRIEKDGSEAGTPGAIVDEGIKSIKEKVDKPKVNNLVTKKILQDHILPALDATMNMGMTKFQALTYLKRKWETQGKAGFYGK